MTTVVFTNTRDRTRFTSHKIVHYNTMSKERFIATYVF